MILDYAFNKSKRQFSVSYITETGGKHILNFNVNRFKSYKSAPEGQYMNWDGSRCDACWTEKPETFDFKTFFEESLSPQHKALLQGKTNPRLYTFDIEVEISDEFPEPSEAKFPITTISVASPDCNVIVMGTKPIDNKGAQNLQKRYEDYLNSSNFFKGLGIKMPYIKYYKFDTERSMLEYFLKEIVAKVPVIAGWNSILFDWQYIQNRLRGYYPDLSLNYSSKNYMMTSKNYTDMRGDKVRLNIPNHTLILDMMDVIGSFDMVVMPIKESLSLDYIASESIGMNKIKYDGDLQKLYDTDYSTYVFYNAIDSILVQLIDKRFKTLNNIYTQALYCKEKIGSCFSKIALSEALFFNHFYKNGIKIIPNKVRDEERGTLVGAYVAKPTPGKHRFVCCNDFASLYPSVLRTCNMSVENFVGKFYDEVALQPYILDKQNYIVVGGAVYKNKGTLAKPELGDFVKYCLQEDVLDKYRKNPKYFVSVNGHVYKNDKDYAFKIIQTQLADNRNSSKYLAKQLEAMVISDIDHIINNQQVNDIEYPKNIIEALGGLGFEIKSTNDIKKIINVGEMRRLIKKEIEYLTSFEQACKLLMNSLYGGSSHISFFWFLIELANDITGEAKNLIKLMEAHIPSLFQNEWVNMKDIHEKLGITVNKTSNKELVQVVAGDTDSLYLCYNQLLNSIDGVEKMSVEQKRDILVKLNTEFLDAHNKKYIEDYYKTRHVDSVHNFELETIAYSECRLGVKKRYAQMLLWKDGKIYDIDKLPMKVKGLEMIKSSYPKAARESLKRMVKYLLEDDSDSYLLQRLNMKMMEEKSKFNQTDLEDVCGNVGVQNYTKYILSDDDPMGLKIAPKTPYNVRALGNYNWIRNIYNLPGDPLYGGKMKWYCYYPNNIKQLKGGNLEYFAFQSRNYPKWADKYAPICRDEMFKRTVLDPFNRIILAVGIGELNPDGSIQLSLF